MTASEKLEKLNNYFIKYIDRMIIKDIELLIKRNDELKFSYPYILLVCSGIDLFGGIEKDFTRPNGQGNSYERFKWFINEWMSKINSLYKEESLAYLIYDSWRCGVMHQATLKKGFETSSYMYPPNKHLHYIEDNDRIYIHSIKFSEDFIEAQKLYRQFINNNASNNSYIESLYNHLLNMINENKERNEQNYEQFVETLKNNNYTFNTTNNSSTSTSTSTSSESSQENITRLPDDDDILTTVSAAPDIDDL